MCQQIQQVGEVKHSVERDPSHMEVLDETTVQEVVTKVYRRYTIDCMPGEVNACAFKQIERFGLDEVCPDVKQQVELPGFDRLGIATDRQPDLDKLVLGNVVEQVLVYRYFVVALVYSCKLCVETNQSEALLVY